MASVEDITRIFKDPRRFEAESLQQSRQELTPEILGSITGFIGRDSIGEKDLPEDPLMAEIRASFERDQLSPEETINTEGSLMQSIRKSLEE